MGGGTYVPPAPAPPLPGAPAPPPPSLYQSAAVETLSQAPTPARSPEPSQHPQPGPLEGLLTGPGAAQPDAASPAQQHGSEPPAKVAEGGSKPSLLQWFGIGKRKKCAVQLPASQAAPDAAPVGAAAAPQRPAAAAAELAQRPAQALADSDKSDDSGFMQAASKPASDSEGSLPQSQPTSPTGRNSWFQMHWGAQPVTAGALPAHFCLQAH
jgi:hypothetical protein